MPSQGPSVGVGAHSHLIRLAGTFPALLAPSPAILQTWPDPRNSRFFVFTVFGSRDLVVSPALGAAAPPPAGGPPALPGRPDPPAAPMRARSAAGKPGPCQHLPAVRIGNPLRAGSGPWGRARHAPAGAGPRLPPVGLLRFVSGTPAPDNIGGGRPTWSPD
jgi:hypothetical protein